MDRGRVGEDRGSKEMDGCPLTIAVTAAAVFIASITTAVFTATAAASVSSASASDRSLHSVNSVRPWSYHPLAPFPQSVMNT
jgi:hypothetical protein